MRNNMMRALGLSSGVRTQKGPLGWICIICFISALDVTVGNDIELQTRPEVVVATCGDSVTLTCELTITGFVSFGMFSWMMKKQRFCHFLPTKEDHSSNKTQFLCKKSMREDFLCLDLTIMKLMPAKEGTYHCMVDTDRGAANRTSIVRLQDCIGESHHIVSESEAECTFSGVYPRGQVKWTLGDTELTDATTVHKEEADGRFTITSKVKKRKQNPKDLYTCSLLLPINSTEQVHMVSKLQFSGSAVVNLTWICMLVEMVLVILVFQF